MRRSMSRLLSRSPQWAVSMAVHGLVLGVLAMFYIDVSSPKARTMVASDLEDLIEQDEVPEELIQDEDLDLEAPVSVMSSGAGASVAEAAEGIAAPSNTAAEMNKVTAAISNRAMLRPLGSGPQGMALGENIGGLVGGFAEATGEGGLGAIQQIVQETSPRWRANFDLTLARLLQAKVRCDSWDWAYSRFEADPMQYVHPVQKRKEDPEHWMPAWGPRFIAEIWVGRDEPLTVQQGTKGTAQPGDATGRKKANKKAQGRAGAGLGESELYTKTMQQAELAKQTFQRVMAQHPGTVWGEAAKVEIRWPLGIHIIPTYYRILDEEKKHREAAQRRPGGF